MVNGNLESIDFNQLQRTGIEMQRDMGEPAKNIFQNGQLQSYNGSMSGGNETCKYFLSAGYEANNGVEPTNKVRRGNGRLNLTVTPSPEWRVDGNFGYVLGRTDLACEAGCGGVTWTTYFMSPRQTSPIPCGAASGAARRTPTTTSTWLWQDVGRFTGSVQVHNNPASWFSHRLTVGIDQTQTQNHDIMNHNDQATSTTTPSRTAAGPTWWMAGPTTRRPTTPARPCSGWATASRPTRRSAPSTTASTIDNVEAYGEGFPVPGLTAVDATTQNRTALADLREQHHRGRVRPGAVQLERERAS